MSSQILRMEDLTVTFSHFPLLDKANLKINSKERICLIGRNGAGKSTLLKTLASNINIHSGNLWVKSGLKIGYLSQDLPEDSDLTVYDYVAGGLAEVGALLKDYQHLSESKPPELSESKWLERLDSLQAKIEVQNGWLFQQKIESTLDILGLFPNAIMNKLSGGWKRKAALAKALVIEPDLLLLDEPTNHLDIETITWIEEQLLSFNGALLFITHDRKLLKKLATRIVELDRGKLTSWDCDYERFLDKKEKFLEEEERQNKVFDKKLAQEEVWIRQGLKARRTRNEGRVRNLESLRGERQQRRERVGSPKFSINKGASSGQLVVELKEVSYSAPSKKLVGDFSCLITRGDKIALVGKNGIGKSTLIKIILGKLKPQKGNVRLGTNLEIAYFDQLREEIDLKKNLMDNVAGGNEFVTINGKQKHAISYLGEFLFSPDRAKVRAETLSGGELNRLLLAKLFCKESNLLVLDEPTNDLDIESLELLEVLISNYHGTVLLVSHDREFIDNTVTSLYMFCGGGKIDEFFGSYSDWLGYHEKNKDKLLVSKAKKKVAVKSNEKTPVKDQKKLSFKEKYELERICEEVELLEAKLSVLQTEVNSSDFYSKPADELKHKLDNLKNIEATLAKLYARWDILEKKNSP